MRSWKKECGLEPVQALLRRKSSESWTDEHHNEGSWKEDGCMKGLYDVGWSDEKKCPGCKKERRH